MFEGLVTWALSKVLGKYVENFDSSKLKISLYKGNVELKDLVLRPSALEELRLPVAVKWGKLGTLKLSVSWQSLLKKPISVLVDEVYLLAVPGTDVPYDKEEEAKREHEIKMALVESLLTAGDNAAAAAAEEGGSGTVFRVVNNVQVDVKRIHVRFEDMGDSSGASPFCMGLTLGELSAKSATETGELVNMKEWPKGLDEAIARKQLCLEGLSVYWNVGKGGFDPMTAVLPKGNASVHGAFQLATPEDSRKVAHTTYLINPISAGGQVTINKKTQPQHELELAFNSIAISLTNEQYSSLLTAADYFAWLSERERYKALRPTQPVRKRTAKLWWKFAFEAIMIDFRRRMQPWSWDNFLKPRRDTRLKYKALFAEAAESKSPPKHVAAALTEIEMQLTADDIVMYRRMVLAEKKIRDAKAAKNKGGWFGWGSSKKTDEAVDPEADLAANKKAFQELMKDEEMTELGGDPSTVGMTAKVVLKHTSVTLIEKSNDGKERDIMLFALAESGLVFKQRPIAEAIWVNLYLGAYGVDMVRFNGELARVVQPFESQGPALAIAGGGKPCNPVDIIFETKPIVPEGEIQPDVRCIVEMLPAEVYVTAPGIKRIMAFFATGPQSDVIDYTALVDAASGVAERQGRAGMQNLVENRKVMDLHVNIAAPKIIIPAKDSKSDQTLCLFLDLGNLKIDSVLQDSSGDLAKRTDQDIAHLAYDVFNINLEGLQIVLGRRIHRKDYAILNQASSPNHLLNRLDVKLVIQKCLQDYHTELASIKVDGELPRLQLVISSMQIKHLAELGKALGEDFGDDGAGDAAANAGSGQNKALSVATEASTLASEAGQPGEMITVGLSEKQIEEKRRKRVTQALNKALDVNFVVGEVSLMVGYYSTTKKETSPMVSVGIVGMHLAAVTRQWDQRVRLNLDGLMVTSHLRDSPVHLIYAHGADVADVGPAEAQAAAADVDAVSSSSFFTADVTNCDPVSPLFSHVDFDRCALRVNVKADALDILADQESLCLLLVKLDDFLRQIKSTVVEVGKDSQAITGPSATQRTTTDIKAVAPQAAPIPAAAPAPAETKKVDPAADFTAMDAVFAFDLFRVKLRAQDTDMAALTIEGLSATLQQQDQGDMAVTARLEGLSLTEMTVDPLRYHSSIATLGGDSVFDMKFAQFAVPQPEDGATGSLSLSLGQLHFVFVQSYIARLSGFATPIIEASNPVSNTTASINDKFVRESNKAALQAAKEAALRVRTRIGTTVGAIKKVLEDAPSDPEEDVAKFRLDVTAEAPLIIIPLNPESNDAMTLNLGVLQVCNAFAEGPKAEYDRMLVTLSKLRACVATYDFRTKDLVEKDPFLTLPAMVCTVDRTIVFKVPRIDGPVDMAIELDAGAIQLMMSTKTIQFILDVLDQNVNATSTSALTLDAAQMEVDERMSIQPSESLMSDTSSVHSEDSIFSTDIEQFGINAPPPPPVSDSNGMTASVKIASISLELIDPSAKAFARVEVDQIMLRLDQDPRGLEYERVDASRNPVRDMVLALSVQDLRVRDLRADDPALHTDVIQSSRSDDTPLLSVNISQTQRAIQIFRAKDYDQETVPICPEALRELLGADLDISFIFEDQWGSRGTILFDSTEGHKDELSSAMRRCRTMLPKLQTIYSHADWDPDATHMDIEGRFCKLNVLLATDFLGALAAFADVQGSAAGGGGAAATAVEAVKEKKVFMWSKGGGQEEYAHESSQKIEIRLEEQRFTLIEDDDGSDGYDGHCIQACISALLLVGSQGEKKRVETQLSGQIASGQFGNPSNLIVPDLQAQVLAQMPSKHLDNDGNVDTYNMGVSMIVQHISARLSLTDLNLIQRITGALGSVADNTSCWFPQPRQIPRTVTADSVGGAVQSEIAEVKVQGVTITLVDDIKASTPPILTASVALVDTVATNWSSQMEAGGEVRLAVASYNSQASTWEPLLLGKGTGDDANSLVPFSANLNISVPENEWVPNFGEDDTGGAIGEAQGAPAGHVVATRKPSTSASTQKLQVIYANKSSKEPPTNMLDGNPKTFWDAGNKLQNYCVFDFGRTVKCTGMRFSSINKSAYAPKNCELFAGVDPDPKSSSWKRVISFHGGKPGNASKKDDSFVHFETRSFSTRTRYLKWVIKDRYSRGAARVSAVQFETSGEGSLTSVVCPRSLELSVSDRFLSELQGHQAAVLSTETREAQNSGKETHEVVNLTNEPITVISPVTNESVIVPPGSSRSAHLPPAKAVAQGTNVGGGTRPIPREYVDMSALVALSGTLEASNALADFTIGEWGDITNIPVGTPSSQGLVCSGRRGAVRVSITVSEGQLMKQIQIGSPVVIGNCLDLPLEIACLTSRAEPEAPDITVAPGSRESFPLGLMENVDPGDLVPLYSFRNATTLRHFYTTDVLDIAYLAGDDWLEQGILGFISKSEGNDTVPLYGSIPAADRPVSTLLPMTKAHKKESTDGLQQLGFVPAPKKGALPADLLALAHHETELGDNVWSVHPASDNEQSAPHGCLYSCSSRLLLRPSAAFGWGRSTVYPRKTPDAKDVQIVSCSAIDRANMPVTFALVRPPLTNAWMACALVGVSNALPYQLEVGISTTVDGNPDKDRITVIAAEGYAPVPVPQKAHQLERVWFKVRLNGESDWSHGGEMSLDPSCASPFENRNLRLAFQQSGVDYKLLLKVSDSKLGIPRARLAQTVCHFSVYCPQVIHNNTGRPDLDCINEEKNGPNLATSLWRPLGAKFTDPALFAPYEDDIDTVYFVAKGQASEQVPLFSLADSAQKVNLKESHFSKLKNVDTLLARKAKANGYDDVGIASGDTFISTTFQWNGASMLFREIYLRPKYEIRNSTNCTLSVLRRVNVGTEEEQVERSPPAGPDSTLQLSFTYEPTAVMQIELEDGRLSTQFTPETSKDGNEVIKFEATDKYAFEAFELVFIERGGAYQGDGDDTEGVEKSRTFTIGIQQCGKRAPFRFENICDAFTCELWQLPPGQAEGQLGNVIKLNPYSGVNWAPENSAIRDKKIMIRLTEACGATRDVVVSLDVDCKKIQVGERSAFIVATNDLALSCRRIFVAPTIGHARLYAGESEFVPNETLESSMSVDIEGVGLSVIATTGSSRELLYINMATIGLTQEVTTHYNKLNVTVKDLQIDNCDRDATYPVLLHRDDRANQAHPLLRFIQISKRGHMGGTQALGPIRLKHQESGRYLHSHKKNLRGPFHEVVVVDHADNNNVFTMSDVALSSVRSGEGDDTIRYGDTVRLKHADTGYYLHSHGEERQPGNHYEVTTFAKLPDENDEWIVAGPTGEGPEAFDIDVEGHLVEVGNIIRLKHKDTKRYLRMADFSGPKTRDHPAASCFSMDWEDRKFLVDDNSSEESGFVDHWVVESAAGKTQDKVQTGESVEYMCLSLQALEVMVDGDMIPSLTDFGKASAPSEYAVALGQQAAATQTTAIAVEQPSHYKELVIHPINVAITFNNSATSDFLAAIPLKLDDFTLQLSSCQLDKQTMKSSELIEKLTCIYTKKAIQYMMTEGVWRGVGSLAILGNPEAALTKIGGGMKALLYDPAKAVVQGPEEFGTALGMGLVNFTGSAISAATGTAQAITSSVGTGLGKLTLDDEFQKKREADMKKTKSLQSGVKTGARRFGRGLFEGVSGVFLDPIKGAKEGGALGALKGVGTGIAGLAFKPAVGAIDLVSGTMAGVGAMAGGARKEAARVRDVRHIDPSGTTPPYSDNEAWGVSFVRDNFPDLALRYVSHTMEQEKKRSPHGHDEYKILFLFTDAIRVVYSEKPEKKGHKNTNVHEVHPLQQAVRIEAVPDTGLVMRLTDTSDAIVKCSDLVGNFLLRLLQNMFSQDGRLEEASDSHLAIRRQTPPDMSPSPGGADAAAAPADGAAAPAPAPAPQDTRVVQLTERMRYYPIKGWTHGVLPTDPPKWELDDGTEYGKRDEVKPPPGWTWISPWTMEEGGDKDNWFYAVDWPQKFHRKKGMMDYVRRRIHLRTAKNISDRASRQAASGVGKFVQVRASFVRSNADSTA